jgi:mono/diheme cytochrome c family protein
MQFALASRIMNPRSTRHMSRTRRIRLATIGALALCGSIGCQRTVEPQFGSSAEVLSLSPELQGQVRQVLADLCGTPRQPKLLGSPEVEPLHLRRGAAIYSERCAACHGTTGDGNGPAAEFLNPRPRDYRRGIFKFTSTPYGSRPRREDLLRTIRAGSKGTSMPSFSLLSDEDQNAVLDHVLALTHRGELELLLFLQAESDDEIDPALAPDLVEQVIAPWREARGQVVLPVTAMPPYSLESSEKGRQAFKTEAAGCYKCHGEDGRGRTTENVKGFQDVWGFPTRAADLTSGMFRGGSHPEDIYRRIYAGINGTPMPSFQQKLADQPETFWHLVHYVQTVSNENRRQVLAEQEARLEAARERARSRQGQSLPRPASDRGEPAAGAGAEGENANE